MFEHLKRHRKIIVTGPPRSGTHIASKMIAHDTGHRYIDEEEHGIGRDEAFWRRIIRQNNNIVVQSPNLIKWCVESPPPGAFIVLMRRDIEDIHASQRRIGYAIGTYTRWFMNSDPVSDLYFYWDTHEKKAPFTEVNYSDLARHSLWVPADKRKDFRFDQTE